tara:strand:- start:174 stop:1142 length:969 start_codon:yes stop_codon:yes gene_type:complete
MVINYICCPNGFGHFRRFYYLNKIFEKKKIKINLFTSRKKWQIFCKEFKVNFTNVVLFNIQNLPVAKDYLNNQYLDSFFLKLNNMTNGEIVISDNYNEICVWNKKVILIANFFWNMEHKSLLNKKNNYLLNQNLKSKNIKIIGNKYFARDYIKKNKNFFDIGFIGPEIKKNNINSKKNIIYLSKGFGSISNKIDKKITDFVKKNIPEDKFDIKIDKNFLPIYKKKYQVINKLNSKFFSKILIIIGRPSFGIITEAFSRKIPFIPIVSEDDSEAIYIKKELIKLFGAFKSIDKFIIHSNKTYKKLKLSFNNENNLINVILNKK